MIGEGFELSSKGSNTFIRDLFLLIKVNFFIKKGRMLRPNQKAR